MNVIRKVVRKVEKVLFPFWGESSNLREENRRLRARISKLEKAQEASRDEVDEISYILFGYDEKLRSSMEAGVVSPELAHSVRQYPQSPEEYLVDGEDSAYTLQVDETTQPVENRGKYRKVVPARRDRQEVSDRKPLDDELVGGFFKQIKKG